MPSHQSLRVAPSSRQFYKPLAEDTRSSLHFPPSIPSASPGTHLHHTSRSGHSNDFTGYPRNGACWRKFASISRVHFPAWVLSNDRPDAPQPPKAPRSAWERPTPVARLDSSAGVTCPDRASDAISPARPRGSLGPVFITSAPRPVLESRRAGNKLKAQAPPPARYWSCYAMCPSLPPKPSPYGFFCCPWDMAATWDITVTRKKPVVSGLL